ncbi:MAG: 50S ribosomal protein L6 [Spirochaetia bacterium]|nr:50S ribosomal protein L6 [Spirochaetota bacterium]MDW8112384.1 50S ribosomal protein L6 [Spirochaetia bacterium]
MSRVGKKPVEIPSDVSVSINNNTLIVKGKLGELKLDINPVVDVRIDGNKIIVSPKADTKFARAMWGTTRALINNMVVGVSKGYSKVLQLVGVGYRARLEGNKLVLNVGYSHPVEFVPPQGIKFNVEEQVKITVSGYDKALVGQVSANIRAIRKPEPYKGKGIRYENEVIVLKEGKKTK